MKVAIHQNHDIFNHSTLWDKEWIQYCEENHIEHKIVNCYDPNILEILNDYDVLLWHISNYSLQDMLFARTILRSAENLGLTVFPDSNTAWHFDDKIAETDLLQSVGAPIPRSWQFYTLKDAMEFFHNECNYPVVAKLRSGSGSSNVKLIDDKYEAQRYAKQMFRKGYRASPNALFKAKSNIRSSTNLEMVIKRFKRIPDFAESLTKARQLPREKGYVFIQEFIPNDGYDLKVVVVGDKLSFLARDVRKGDFRASGGGTFKYDKRLITPDIQRMAFELSETLGFQCMGYDFVIDNRDNSAKIVEISYGFSHTAQMDLGGYWDRTGAWHDEPLNAPQEVLRNILLGRRC